MKSRVLGGADSAKDVENWIGEMRQSLGPSKVRQHHCPRWMSTRLRKWAKAHIGDEYRWLGPAGVLDRIIQRDSHYIGNVIDHWGSTTLNDVQFFVLEPYPSYEAAHCAVKIADALGLAVTILPTSWHFPGNTIRIAFRQPDDRSVV